MDGAQHCALNQNSMPRQTASMEKAPQTPRGIRNNNPGNIRWSNIPWQGLVQHRTDPDFCQFVDAYHGIRALALNLHDYGKLHGIHTLRAAIERWAPPSENDTGSYLAFVAKKTGIDPDADIDLADWLTVHDITRAIIQRENGPGPFSGAWYSTDTLSRSVTAALGVSR